MNILPSPDSSFAWRCQKPQAKNLSPASRNLFGNSDPSSVKDMLDEAMGIEVEKAVQDFNFDICNEMPLNLEEQENITDRTLESGKKYCWKMVKPGGAPQFYFKNYNGKKSLMPVNLLSHSPEPVSLYERAQSVRRSLNADLLPSSQSKGSPVHTNSSPLRSILPCTFDDHSGSNLSSSLPKPQPVHATSENALTVKALTPSITSNLIRRSPLTQRNRFGIARAIDFSSAPKHFSFVKTSKVNERITKYENESKNQESSKSASEIVGTTPKNSSSAHSALKQLKITDMATIRKLRSPAMKARKRLKLSDDSSLGSPSPKTMKLLN